MENSEPELAVPTGRFWPAGTTASWRLTGGVATGHHAPLHSSQPAADASGGLIARFENEPRLWKLRFSAVGTDATLDAAELRC